jgi:hypothetical protein
MKLWNKWYVVKKTEQEITQHVLKCNNNPCCLNIQMNFQGCFPRVFTYVNVHLHKRKNSYHVLRNPRPLLQHTMSDVSVITITMVNTGKSLLRDLLLHNCALMRPNILHHFLNLRDSVWFRAIWHRHMIIFGFNVMWHRQNVTTLVLCWRPAERVVTVVPSVMCMDWLHWWHKHAAGVVPAPSTLASGKKMNEKCTST